MRPEPDSFQHHSLTLPAMSNWPNGPTPGSEPTAIAPLGLKLLWSRISLKTALGPAKAPARGRWNGVGSDLPANSAYAAASYQLTPPMGKLSCDAGKVPSSHVAGPGLPVRSRKRGIACSKVSGLPFSTNGSFQNSRRVYPPASTNALN